MNVRGFVHLLVVYIVWGSTYLAIRIAVRDGAGFPAFAMAGTRVVRRQLDPAHVGRAGEKSLRPTRNDVQMFTASGVLLWLGGNGLVIVAEKRAASGYAALLGVVASPVDDDARVVLDRRRPTLRLVGSLLIGMAGIVGAEFSRHSHGSHADLVACLILLLAVCSWGIGSVMQKRRPVTLSGEVNSGYQLLFGAFLLLLAASWLTGEPRPHPTTEAVAGVGLLGRVRLRDRIHVVRQGTPVAARARRRDVRLRQSGDRDLARLADSRRTHHTVDDRRIPLGSPRRRGRLPRRATTGGGEAPLAELARLMPCHPNGERHAHTLPSHNSTRDLRRFELRQRRRHATRRSARSDDGRADHCRLLRRSRRAGSLRRRERRGVSL